MLVTTLAVARFVCGQEPSIEAFTISLLPALLATVVLAFVLAATP